MFDHDRVEQLASDFDPRTGGSSYNADNATLVLGQAEGVVKNALSLQYTTVQLEADAGIARMVGDMAMYYLEFRRSNFSPEVKSAYANAGRLLDQLRNGDAKLSGVTQLLPTGPTSEPTEATDSGYFE